MKQTFYLLFLFVLFSTFYIAAQNTISYTYDQAGNRISRTITLGPGNVKRHQPTDSVVIKETIGERTIKVFPNPTRGALGIEIQGGDPKQELRLQIYSGAGAVLYNQPATEGLNSIEMTAYPEGWYVLRVVAGEKQTEFKIIKQ